MKKYLRILLLFLFLSVSCSNKELSQSPQEKMPDIAQGINQFGLDMLQLLAEGNPQNIFYSPFSISSALAMSYAGAKGNTAAEMRKALYYGPQTTEFHANYATLIKKLQENTEKDFSLHIANALWFQKSYALNSRYLEIVQEFYDGKAREMDFTGDAQGSRRIINKHISDWTNERIKDLLPEGSVNALTRLILTNAVYFNAEWMQAFNEEMTRKEQFFPLQTNPYPVDMMYQRLHYYYSAGDNYDVLELDYKGAEQSMLIFLPREKEGLAPLLKDFKLSQIALHDSSKEWEDVILYLPKFRLETRYELQTLLRALGIQEAFAAQADFSGISSRKSKDLMISDVIHKAFIDVDEKKTEAAAATGLVMRMTAMPPLIKAPLIFRADHPFLFIIRDKSSGSFLFMGCLTNPEAK